MLLGPGDRVVLTALGIALTAGSSTLTQTGQMVGSIPCMAPERLRGLTPGPASDLWSVGPRSTRRLRAGRRSGARPRGRPRTPSSPTPSSRWVDYPAYRRLRMQRTASRGQPAAVWEFTFRGRARVFRVIDLGYGREGGREYAIYLSARRDRGHLTYRPVFDNVRDGFRTTGRPLGNGDLRPLSCPT
ncbi:protein kinase family protein [Streptomyces sp. NPDC001714]|uniref:hypothetical protein n=1 Tax=Streptomyces sp. NPDC001714 TaxID=3364603 RepID=UPI00367619D0